MEVSTGSEVDYFEVVINLSNYTNPGGTSFPQEPQLRHSNIMPQYGSALEAAVVEVISVILEAGIQSVVGPNFLLNFLIMTGLSQMWALINGQQISVFLPLLSSILFPSNAAALNSVIISIATFDMVDTNEYFDKHIFEYPEETPFNKAFERFEYESSLIIVNISIIVWTYLFFWFLCFINGIFFCVRKTSGGRVGNYCNNKLSSYLMWGTLIRLFMESFLDIVMFSILNVHQIDWSGAFHSVTISNGFAIGYMTLFAVIAPFLFILYCRNRGIWQNMTVFGKKYGAALDDANLEKNGPRKMILLWLFIFFVRRFGLAISAVLFPDFLVGHVLIQTLCTLIMITILLCYRIKDENKIRNLELFNEVTLLLLTYLILVFSEYVPNSKTRHTMGYWWIGIQLFNLLVHIVYIQYC